MKQCENHKLLDATYLCSCGKCFCTDCTIEHIEKEKEHFVQKVHGVTYIGDY